MIRGELHARLCWYDPRNPDSHRDEGSPPPRRPGCACDPCFYGRDRLAVTALELLDVKEGLLTALKNLLCHCDIKSDGETGFERDVVVARQIVAKAEGR